MARGGPVRLNVGCGRHVIDGWVNIDAARSKRAPRDPDILCNVQSIPLPDECADELHAIHIFEHFYYWETDGLIEEWKRLLKRGGLLVLELPDIIKCARNLIAGMEPRNSYWGFYGDPSHQDPFMCHRWGWTPDTLRGFLEVHGFVKIKEGEPEWHRKSKDVRDMRITACKP